MFTFSNQLFKPFLAATPLGAVEPLQMTISPRQLFSRVLPLGTTENCLDSPHLPASDHRTSWLLTNHEFAGGHLLRLGRNRHQLLPTSPAMAITSCHCSWISACRQLASIALAETLKPNSRSTSPDPMEITQSSYNDTSQWHSWHHGHTHRDQPRSPDKTPGYAPGLKNVPNQKSQDVLTSSTLREQLLMKHWTWIYTNWSPQLRESQLPHLKEPDPGTLPEAPLVHILFCPSL